MCIIIIIILLDHTSSNCPRIITLEILPVGQCTQRFFWSNAHDRFIIKLSLILGRKRVNNDAMYSFLKTPAFHTNIVDIHI